MSSRPTASSSTSCSTTRSTPSPRTPSSRATPPSSPTKLKVVGEPFSTEPYGIGLGKDDSALRNKINNIQLQAAYDDGTWKQIYEGTLGKSGSPADPPPLQRY